ncbi:ABC transporter substrate-binding protein [Chromobacterium paludis]|uniref:ABC transporter substrate-binding protein n=1 Tax=Chromobacterium paludis TaxID=2605945 RepID=A0A5C1DJ25_9NEIS|nr:ABC transporter substrate-binding protein [Chromobacterium paludis]QEL55728.1 ABC transporter substrate-binding protein [Chromobacterium paludis]
MPRPEVDALCQAIAAAGARRDWQTLSGIDQRLRDRLAAPDAGWDDEDRQALAAAYRGALARSQAESDALRHRLAAIGQQREGQLAYAQFSEWEPA